jgi:anthranilate synthase component 1
MNSTDPTDPMSAAGPARRVRPFVREYLADTVTPLSLYRSLAGPGLGSFLFESVTGGEQVSRFSFLGAAPSQQVRVFADRLEVVGANGAPAVRLQGRPLERLRSIVEGYRVDDVAGQTLPPFAGGWVGFFGYDVVRLIERLPAPRPVGADGDERPLAILARFDRVLAFDHARHRVLAVSNALEGEIDEREALAALDELGRVVTRDVAGRALELPRQALTPLELPAASLPSAEFRSAVEVAKEHIRAGDIFQVVLARRWTVPTSADSLALYRAVRLVNPSPYMVLLEFPEVSLVGSSPEMLVRVAQRQLETRPIAGTRRRGNGLEEDARLAEDLLADEKERAEHVMLVDLGRNDVGRVSRPGSVRVRQFMEVERYSHVMHLVSSVVGELDPERSPFDALLSCFPAGTVSGAPKIRALQIIDGLEPEGRGEYAGAVGYLSFTGDVDTCITIRTLVVRGGTVSLTAGAGIVADSDPASEERETESKAAALLAAARLAEELVEPRGLPR